MPNMEELITRKYPYAFNFEHTYCITESYVDLILKKYGFEIDDKEYFEDHSIFYSAEKNSEPFAEGEDPFQDKELMRKLYDHNRGIFFDYIDSYDKRVRVLNESIEDYTGEVFIFGAHINTQLLINFGLKTEQISGILDNDPLKQGNRLYGTTLMVSNPKVLKEKVAPMVLLVMGTYNTEIREDIVGNINPATVFVE